MFERAAAALASREYQAAERGFQAVLKAEPDNLAALGNLGVVYSRTRRYSEAINAYRRALKAAPHDQGLRTNLGLAYVKQEQFSLALPIFSALAADPGNRQARELLGACQLSLGHFESAIQTLEPLAGSDNPGVLYMLGVALEKAKRPKEAHAAFARMMQAVRPAQANFLMGKASYETGHFEQAAEFFRNALEADPAFPEAHRELGKTLISLRDNAAAQSELRRAASDDAEALYFLGALFVQEHRDEAIPLLTRVLELTPDFWGPWYYLGRFYLEQDQTKQAISYLERAAKLKTNEPAIYYQLGSALRKAGQEKEARAAFLRVKELKSSHLNTEIDLLNPVHGLAGSTPLP